MHKSETVHSVKQIGAGERSLHEVPPPPKGARKGSQNGVMLHTFSKKLFCGRICDHLFNGFYVILGFILDAFLIDFGGWEGNKSENVET